jgi:hypothetical protein
MSLSLSVSLSPSIPLKRQFIPRPRPHANTFSLM